MQFLQLPYLILALYAVVALILLMLVAVLVDTARLLWRRVHRKRAPGLFALPYDGWIADIIERGFNRDEMTRIGSEACTGRDDALRLWFFDPSRIKDAALRKRVLACAWPDMPPGPRK